MKTTDSRGILPDSLLLRSQPLCGCLHRRGGPAAGCLFRGVYDGAAAECRGASLPAGHTGTLRTRERGPVPVPGAPVRVDDVGGLAGCASGYGCLRALNEPQIEGGRKSRRLVFSLRRAISFPTSETLGLLSGGVFQLQVRYAGCSEAQCSKNRLDNTRRGNPQIQTCLHTISRTTPSRSG